jgi:hypothetical protein
VGIGFGSGEIKRVLEMGRGDGYTQCNYSHVYMRLNCTPKIAKMVVFVMNILSQFF